MARADTEHFKNPSVVRCDQCDLLHPDSTRERARQHVVKHNHTVRVVIEHVTVYRKPAGAP